MSGSSVQRPRAATAARDCHLPLAFETHTQPPRRGALSLAFAATVARYLATVLPVVTVELRRWRRRAEGIPDPALRALALDALSKRGNMEGAALFAALAPRGHRRDTVRALVSFQTAYNYLDTLAEQPSSCPVANSRRLHEALLVALDPSSSHLDYYAHHPQRDDGGFLTAIVDTCRAAFASLPSHAAVGPAVVESAARIVAFQSLNLTHAQGGHSQLEDWARGQTPEGSGLHWFQTAGAAGSSLAVHALIAAAAADPDVRPAQAASIQGAYFPWIGALHSLLDSLADVEEDAAAGQRNLLAYHDTPAQAAFAMKILARRACAAADSLGAPHRVILTAMVAYYLSSAGASAPRARPVGDGVTAAIGPLHRPAVALFRCRRVLARLSHGAYR
jgi:tetraprenyl-beta-curcumene synthase